MCYSASKMLFPENHFGKHLVLRNAFVDCHPHLPKHQSYQPSGACSSHKLEHMTRM